MVAKSTNSRVDQLNIDKIFSVGKHLVRFNWPMFWVTLGCLYLKPVSLFGCMFVKRLFFLIQANRALYIIHKKKKNNFCLFYFKIERHWKWKYDFDFLLYTSNPYKLKTCDLSCMKSLLFYYFELDILISKHKIWNRIYYRVKSIQNRELILSFLSITSNCRVTISCPSSWWYIDFVTILN